MRGDVARGETFARLKWVEDLRLGFREKRKELTQRARRRVTQQDGVNRSYVGGSGVGGSQESSPVMRRAVRLKVR
jgi:hypothetical protein